MMVNKIQIRKFAKNFLFNENIVYDVFSHKNLFLKGDEKPTINELKGCDFSLVLSLYTKTAATYIVLLGNKIIILPPLIYFVCHISSYMRYNYIRCEYFVAGEKS